jgi:hypothetical protein
LSGDVDPGLPSKASCRKGDPHYDVATIRLSERIDIFVDGKLVWEASSWDCDAGEITQPARFEDGHPILDNRGVPASTLIKGRVEVRWARGKAA